MVGEILGDVWRQDTRCQRYEIQQQLGKKAGRRTLLARDQVTGESVVVKLLSFSSDFEWDDLKLFEREAETLKALSHPCIPRYLDYFEVNLPTIKGFALVQSYIAAQTLEQYLQTGQTFTEAEVKQVAKAVLEILLYLHGLHPPVIHRDLKPSNILLGDRSGNSIGEVYLVDFGSVQNVLAAEGGTRTVVGTYGYMPQEQFGGRTVAASDLYSLGATLIYLVTGIHPADLPQKDFRIQFEQLANLNPSLTRWLQRITEPSLEKRFSSATEALAALDEPQFLNTTALVVGKPAGSKIQLTKNWDSLEIFIPPVGFHLSLLVTVTMAIAWSSMIIPWTITALLAPFPANIPIVLFSLLFWGTNFYFIYPLLFDLFGRVRLRLNQRQIALVYELFGFKFHRPSPSLRKNINKLVYVPKHLTKDSDGSHTQVLAQLEIWAGVRKYQVGGNGSAVKSEAELKWLAEELSDWLNIPITRE